MRTIQATLGTRFSIDDFRFPVDLERRNQTGKGSDVEAPILCRQAKDGSFGSFSYTSGPQMQATHQLVSLHPARRFGF